MKIFVILVLIVACFSLPIANLLTQRPFLTIAPQKTNDPQFVQFSKQLQISCANCHTPGLTQYPFYFKLPIAKDIIQKDIEDAQHSFTITPEQLTGEASFTFRELREIRKEIEDDAMPPLQYVILHWESILEAKQKQDILAYIDSQTASGQLQPLTLKNIPRSNPQKAALGKALYFDKRLSGDNSVSCASCHALDKGGTDQSQVSTGIHGQKGPINSPTVFNSAFNVHQFWDGRARDLREQAAGPVTNPKEMGSTWPQVLEKLAADKAFTKQFKSVYPDGFTAKNITHAIAEYEKTLVTPNSPYDRFLLGDKSALTAEQQRGYKLFISNNCISCHSGVALGGQGFEKMGQKENYFAWRKRNLNEEDNGRFSVTKRESDRHKFKVPILRNIALTYPYFHDGSTSHLVEAVQIMSRFQNGKKLSDPDAQAIARFLEATTGEIPH